MKVKLLKKLRKRAYKEIGMCAYLNSNNHIYYRIVRRKDKSHIEMALNYDYAVRKLNEYRRLNILKWVKERQREIIHKNIVKL